jgi:aspartyl-tRNA(Asn)/glutamyl-tRNA(Gln) amidotransferase subunit A
MTRRTFAALLAAPAAAKITADDGLFFDSVTNLSRRLRAKEFSSVELTRAFCDRLERLGPRYNSLALLLREAAIREAKLADEEIKRDRLRSPLQGVPYAAKDLLTVEGLPTTWGAKPYAGQVFDYTATVLRKLSKARAVLIGKLAMIELAGGPSYSGPGASLTGPALNPWNRGHWAGGSSSGSGAAVAAGLVPWAIGTETSGSILTPAAFCGITGLRPTYGLVSRHGAMALSHSLDKIGPMARSAEDCGFALAVMAGGDDQDADSAGKNFYFAPQYARPAKEIRFGYAPIDFEVWAEEAIRPALQSALEVFRSFGGVWKEKKLPADFPTGAVGTLIQGEAAFYFRDLIASGKVDELADAQQIEGLKKASGVTAADYLKAKQQQRDSRRIFEDLFADIDVLIAPGRLGVANRIAPFERSKPPSEDRGNSAIIPASNLAGVPAITLPCGFANGLPVGIQLVSRWFNENMLLALGMEFQRRTDWHTKRPQV